jgi:hypothetical protein
MLDTVLHSMMTNDEMTPPLRGFNDRALARA